MNTIYTEYGKLWRALCTYASLMNTLLVRAGPREAPWVMDVLVLEGAMISEHCFVY